MAALNGPMSSFDRFPRYAGMFIGLDTTLSKDKSSRFCSDHLQISERWLGDILGDIETDNVIVD